MDKKTKAEWTRLGNILAATDPAKLDHVIAQLQAVTEAQALIARYDHQLILRSGRPAKRYLA